MTKRSQTMAKQKNSPKWLKQEIRSTFEARGFEVKFKGDKIFFTKNGVTKTHTMAEFQKISRQ
ncbi:MAG TPA: hypothetical protein VJB67_01040 [Patescibacteria group bacterium]|nr:hypothetical protein [Patescibacteria group bacterium]